MDEIKSDIDENSFLNGATLGEAIFRFGDEELIQKYNFTIKDPKEYFDNVEETEGFLGFLQYAVEGLNNHQITKYEQKDIIKNLQGYILKCIKNGELMPFGFQLPRNLKDTPVKLPIDLFLSGEINWEKSELIYKDLEFAGIRLINSNIQQNQGVVINAKNNKNELNKENKSEELKNKNSFADLDPELHIDEKKAAKLLGLSPRTLQGYRTKGGSPEFIKMGNKAVRYKIADLIKWCDGKKKNNTSEY